MKVILILDIEVAEGRAPEMEDVACISRSFETSFLPVPGLRIMFDEKSDPMDEERYGDLLKTNEELTAGVFTVESVTYLADDDKVHVSCSQIVGSRASLACYIRWLKEVHGFEQP